MERGGGPPPAGWRGPIVKKRPWRLGGLDRSGQISLSRVFVGCHLGLPGPGPLPDESRFPLPWKTCHPRRRRGSIGWLYHYSAVKLCRYSCLLADFWLCRYSSLLANFWLSRYSSLLAHFWLSSNQDLPSYPKEVCFLYYT